jgi:RimJ/RimL family protein N-acetyltransferase
MVIRKANLSDAHALTDVHVSSWRVAYRDIFPARVIDEMCSTRLERWTKSLSDTSSIYRALLCEQDGRVAGFATYSPSRDEGDDKNVIAELCALYVHPEFWNRGCGRALTHAVIDRVREGAWRHLIVWCLTDNHPARRFYERVGFFLDGKNKTATIAGEPFAEVRFSRPISANGDSAARAV